MKLIKLTNRLKALAELVEEKASVADIGTDHGHLPVYLAQTGLKGRIIASDISSASLSAARRSADRYDVADAITFIAAPGLDAVDPMDVDTIIIAGVGGETILRILDKAPWTKLQKMKLILQPQSKIDTLIKFLYDNNYEIIEIKTVPDRKKNYTIIHAAGSKS